MVKVQIDSQGKVYTSNGKALLVQEGSGTPTIESLSITPTTSSQTIIASGDVDGYSPITVSAVTSSIDINIQASNIKKNIQILGVTGTLESGITPSGTLSVTQNGTYDVTNYASANVNVSGGSSSKYSANINTLLGDVNANGVLQYPTEQSDLVFTGVKDVVNYGLNYKFAYGRVKSVSFPDLTTISGSAACNYMCDECSVLTTVSFPNLTTISGDYACNYMFRQCTALKSVLFPNLTTISGNNGCYCMLYSCTALTSVSFPNLTTISGRSACQYMLQFCTAITDVYFPALTSASFGSYKNQFQSMMSNTGATTTHTLHFPSNLESTISGLTGYPLFAGTSGKVVLAYDLPATS